MMGGTPLYVKSGKILYIKTDRDETVTALRP